MWKLPACGLRHQSIAENKAEKNLLATRDLGLARKKL